MADVEDREASGNVLIALVLGFLLRIILTIFGQYQDKYLQLKYTDIDYNVFTDAASHVVRGGSPYLRPTYRYTPLLAWLLTPNILLHDAFGKLLFVIFDVIAGYLIYKILHCKGLGWRTSMYYSFTWLFNPVPMVVSSRGNAEPVLAVLILMTIYCAVRKHISSAAFFFAIAVHFKIYPIIYSLPLFLFVGDKTITPCQGTAANQCKRKGRSSSGNRIMLAILYLINRERLKFTFVCTSTFIAINLLFYYKYGFEFLEHSYLYHVTRRDVKHNFSVYFYMLYLTMDSPALSKILGLLAFLPQLILTLILGVKYYRDISFCCFTQTFVFVIFNKVCTSQYFLWYLCLLPLILPWSKISINCAVTMAVTWFGSQGLWLLLAYLLEFQGINTFLYVWLASLLFFFVNVWILRNIIINHVGNTRYGDSSHFVMLDEEKKSQ